MPGTQFSDSTSGHAVLAFPPLTALVPAPKPGSINLGLKSPGNDLMTQLFGRPRNSYGTDCQEPTNSLLMKNLKTGQVGNFRVRGLAPAVDSLRQVMQDIRAEQPAVHEALGSAGMLCCRFQRGSTSKISNHAWGTAIDLTVNGVLDPRGDDKVQFGLTLVAPIFNRHGWYWGAAFPVEVGMHFEAGAALVQQWSKQLGSL